MALQMGLGLVQEQRLKMVMTPELRQSIQLLQYSAVDLLQYVEEQMAENPLLEWEETQEEAQKLENWLRWLKEPPLYRGRGTRQEERRNPLDVVVASEPTLADVLREQLCDFRLDRLRRAVCMELIHHVDERGYLDADLSEICKRFRVSESVVEECLQVIQMMDPPGVGARSLTECLEIQLKRRKTCHPLALPIVRHHLYDVAEGRWRKIAQALGADVTEVQRAVDEIKTCHPRPGSGYSSVPPRYIVPDVIVEEVDGEFVVQLHESKFPRLSISRHYQQLLRRREDLGAETLQYVKNWMQSALWLVKGIEQRRDTLTRVAQAVVDRQRDFFAKGIEYLKPLTLKQIADELDLHESTVSRVTQHKYMQTPRGLFPFRFFFPTGLATEMGEDLSAKTVKEKIRQMIAEEDKANPLSDQKISERLQGEGIRISRRTVAKYREEMGIPSSAVRKRFA
jgi:RNA polymerase sigma-54 factor